MLVDTSILLRALQPQNPLLPVVRTAIKSPTAQGHQLSIMPQNLVELWVVATRPAGQNGLGMTPMAAASELERIKSQFFLLQKRLQSIRFGKAWSLATPFQASLRMTHGWSPQ